MLRILIISYYFPPNPSVGSRRWAKFAKYLKRAGHDVSVIAAETESSSSPWDKDIEGIQVERLQVKYPMILTRVPKSILEKISYKLSALFLKLMVRGTIYDRTVFWESQLNEAARRIVRDRKIDLVISNGPPHRLMFYSVKLKEEFPGLQVWSDLRDPWTWWYNLGYPYLSSSNKEVEEKMEAYVLKNSDRVFTPVKEMTSFLKGKYQTECEKIITLPHGIDMDELPSVLPDKRTNLHGNKFIYFGSLYLGLDQFYEKFIEKLNVLKSIQLDIYTADHNYRDKFDSASAIEIKAPLPAPVLFKKIADYDFFLLVFPEQFRNYFSSKFYEVIALRIPIIYIGYPGDTASFIQQNNLGQFFDLRKTEEFFKWLEKPELVKFNDSFPIEEYSFETLTQKLLQEYC